MNAKTKAKWIAELKSGRWTQIIGSYGVDSRPDTDERCALGVLCEVELISPNKLDTLLSGGEQGRISDLNDSGANFDTVASYIEQNIKED